MIVALTALLVSLGGVAGAAAGAIGPNGIANNAIQARHIAPNAVGASEVASNAITAAEIKANAIQESEVAAGAIRTSEIADDAITAADLAERAVAPENLRAMPGASVTRVGNADLYFNGPITPCTFWLPRWNVTDGRSSHSVFVSTSDTTRQYLTAVRDGVWNVSASVAWDTDATGYRRVRFIVDPVTGSNYELVAVKNAASSAGLTQNATATLEAEAGTMIFVVPESCDHPQFDPPGFSETEQSRFSASWAAPLED
jgi:hypothetical protein